MKKTLKLLAVIAVLLVMLVSLTGCGNKIVATKETEQNGVTYEEKLEIKLKDDKINKVKVTMTFEDKETAEEMKTNLDAAMAMLTVLGGGDSGIEVEQKNKKIIIELDAEQYASMYGEEIEEISKDELKAQLEEEGYDVK